MIKPKTKKKQVKKPRAKVARNATTHRLYNEKTNSVNIYVNQPQRRRYVRRSGKKAGQAPTNKLSEAPFGRPSVWGTLIPSAQPPAPAPPPPNDKALDALSTSLKLLANVPKIDIQPYDDEPTKRRLELQSNALQSLINDAGALYEALDERIVPLEDLSKRFKSPPIVVSPPEPVKPLSSAGLQQGRQQARDIRQPKIGSSAFGEIVIETPMSEGEEKHAETDLSKIPVFSSVDEFVKASKSAPGPVMGLPPLISILPKQTEPTTKDGIKYLEPPKAAVTDSPKVAKLREAIAKAKADANAKAKADADAKAKADADAKAKVPVMSKADQYKENKKKRDAEQKARLEKAAEEEEAVRQKAADEETVRQKAADEEAAKQKADEEEASAKYIPQKDSIAHIIKVYPKGKDNKQLTPEQAITIESEIIKLYPNTKGRVGPYIVNSTYEEIQAMIDHKVKLGEVRKKKLKPKAKD